MDPSGSIDHPQLVQKPSELVLHHFHTLRVDASFDFEHEACLYVFDVVHVPIVLVFVDPPQLVLIAMVLVTNDGSVDGSTASLNVEHRPGHDVADNKVL